MNKKFVDFIKINQSNGIMKSFLFSGVMGAVLILIRIIFTKELTFLFLIWNMFLAMIPYCISNFLESRPVLCSNKIKLFSMLMVWLLFLPNAPYIITDFFHLYDRPEVPQWYDLIIITIFAWNGMIAGFISLLTMQKIISEKYSIKTGWIFVLGVLMLTGFGVYIGRYLRYNSWDVLIFPFSLFSDIVTILVNPGKHKEAYGMSMVMAVFLTTAYFMFFNLIKPKYKL